jgi:predicted RNA binding protein YcfA (HicA-like mRNA interferase family)
MDPCGDQRQPPPTHKIKKGRVTVPGKLSADLQPGALKSILRQDGLED